jgi:hypothetical protein
LKILGDIIDRGAILFFGIFALFSGIFSHLFRKIPFGAVISFISLYVIAKHGFRLSFIRTRDSELNMRNEKITPRQEALRKRFTGLSLAKKHRQLASIKYIILIP